MASSSVSHVRSEIIGIFHVWILCLWGGVVCLAFSHFLYYLTQNNEMIFERGAAAY